jgi:hypothetical protein
MEIQNMQTSTIICYCVLFQEGSEGTVVFPAKDLPQEADFYQFQYIKAQELTEKYNLNSLCDELSSRFVLFWFMIL